MAKRTIEQRNEAMALLGRDIRAALANLETQNNMYGDLSHVLYMKHALTAAANRLDPPPPPPPREGAPVQTFAQAAAYVAKEADITLKQAKAAVLCWYALREARAYEDFRGYDIVDEMYDIFTNGRKKVSAKDVNEALRGEHDDWGADEGVFDLRGDLDDYMKKEMSLRNRCVGSECMERRDVMDDYSGPNANEVP